MSSIILPTVRFPSQTPSIHTARLLLREFRGSDLPAIYKLRTVHDVMQWTSKGTIDRSEDESEQWMQQFIYEDDQTERKGYNFVVLKRPTHAASTSSEPVSQVGLASQEGVEGTFIGVLGIHRFDPPGLPEVGYMFLPEAWGSGYATEALRGFQQAWWGLPHDDTMVFSLSEEEREIRTGSMRAFTTQPNAASAAVLTKCGWVVEKEFQDGETKVVSWILTRHSHYGYSM